jgi:hypothetical protein
MGLFQPYLYLVKVRSTNKKAVHIGLLNSFI